MNLHLEKISEKNKIDVEKLNIFSNQIQYIESVKECLEEANELECWKPLAIYDEDVLIGFTMYGYFDDPKPEGRVWLDRFLIDKNYQGKGYGKKAVLLILEKIKKEYKKRYVFLSVYDANQTAIHLYKKIGFKFNGEVDTKGEKVMCYDFEKLNKAIF